MGSAKKMVRIRELEAEKNVLIEYGKALLAEDMAMINYQAELAITAEFKTKMMEGEVRLVGLETHDPVTRGGVTIVPASGWVTYRTAVGLR